MTGEWAKPDLRLLAVQADERPLAAHLNVAVEIGAAALNQETLDWAAPIAS